MLSRSGIHAAHATAIVQKAEEEAGLCGGAINHLTVELRIEEEELERTQRKASWGVPSTPCSADNIITLLTPCRICYACLFFSTELHTEVHT